MTGRSRLLLLAQTKRSSESFAAAFADDAKQAGFKLVPGRYDDPKALKEARKRNCRAAMAIISDIDSPEHIPVLPKLKALGVTAMNSFKALCVTHDKIQTHHCLVKHSIPTPRTTIATQQSEIKHQLAQLDCPYPIIVKGSHGATGHDVYLCETSDDAISIAQQMKAVDQTRTITGRTVHMAGVLFQEYLPQGNTSLRIIVCEGEVIAAAKHIARNGEFRSNVANGAKSVPVTLPANVVDLCIRTAAALGQGFAGIDLAPDPSSPAGYSVLESECAPGHQISKTSGVNIRARHLEALAARVKAKQLV